MNNHQQVFIADPTPILNDITGDPFYQNSLVSLDLTGINFGANPRVCINGACTSGSNSQTSSGGVVLVQQQCSSCNVRIPIALQIAAEASEGAYNITVISQGAMGGGFQAPPQGQSQPQSNVQSIQVQRRFQSVSQVTKYNDAVVDPLYLSTGDTSGRIITTSTVPSNLPFSVTYTSMLLSNPNSVCNATLAVPDGSAIGFINSPVSAGLAGCSGIFFVRAAADGIESINSSAVVVPPQILIQMLYGEANGQPRMATPDLVSQRAIGVATRNRFSQSGWSGVTTYQSAITPQQFMGIATSIVDGPHPELQASAEVYSGTTAVSVLNAGCFFSPTLQGWTAIQDAYQSQTQQVPSVSFDPMCYSGSAFPEGRQFIIKESIGMNADGRGAPAFIFVQPRPQA